LTHTALSWEACLTATDALNGAFRGQWVSDDEEVVLRRAVHVEGLGIGDPAGVRE
jgi:hypothetical protein